MIIAIGGVRVSVQPCPDCMHGRVVRTPGGALLGHYRSSLRGARGTVAYDVSPGCPGSDARPYMTRVTRARKSDALIASIREIIS